MADPEKDGMRQVLFVHEASWEATKEFWDARGVRLVLLPEAITEDPIPTYILSPKEMRRPDALTEGARPAGP